MSDSDLENNDLENNDLENSDFENFALDDKILKAVKEMGFKGATPIQAAVIPHVLENKNILALAETGSGKTAACGVPLCQLVDTENKVAQALILVPTRELALQYATELQNIGKYKNVTVFGVLGGECIHLQRAKIEHGVQILVATPGRLIDMIYSQYIDLSQIKTVILDEADKMLSMGFLSDVSFILDCFVQKYQFLMFSATMASDLKKQMLRYLGEHEEFHLNVTKKGPDKLKHLQYFCDFREKVDVLEKLIKDKKPGQSMIFCASRIECEKLQRELSKRIRSVDYLHGGLNQNLRTTISQKYDKGKIQHLVVTDVAGRGLDYKGITHVFIYTLTKDVDSYVHRSGRTARSNREGECITLITSRDFRTLELLLKRVDKPVNWIKAPPSQGGSSSTRNHQESPQRQQRERKDPPGLKVTEKKKESTKADSAKEDRPQKPKPKPNPSLLKPPEFKANLGLKPKS
ncbi:DEAD-box ATP-dependent RNA helicase CshA [Chlamydiales bacterium SCGC AB-751-O23]|nr:DEAD-box ATP-dependent RNA helicase CshA [Chlamydiales bacterium SCGC AB-751-O23]